jgi:hypothetical protein
MSHEMPSLGRMRTLAVTVGALAGLALAGSAAAAGHVVPPKNTSLPAIFGDVKVGHALAATSGTWTGTQPIILSYRWRDCDTAGTHCADIPGATSASYSPVTEVRNGRLRVAVTAKNSAGSRSVVSSPTSIVQAGGSGFNVGHIVSSFALTWLPVLFFVLMCVVVWLLWRTVKLMPRVKPMEITPGSASAVTWADVAGLDEAKEELQEIVDFLRNPEHFESLGARVP